MPTRTNRLQATFGSSGTPHGTGVATTGAFTPSNNSLLYVVATFIAATDDASEGTSLTISDSLTSTWTSRAATATSPAWSYGIRVWTTPITTGASMTVSIDVGATSAQYIRIEVYDFTSYDTTTPIAGAITGSDADGDGAHSITLGATPRTDSILMAHMFVGLGSTTGTVTENANWTLLFETNLDDWGVAHSQFRTGTTSTSVDWDDLLATGTPFGGAVSLAMEVRDAAAAGPTITDQPDPVTGYSGGTVQFTVAATSSGGTLTYQWQRSTNSGASYSNVSGGSGGTSATYTTPTLGFEENGYLYRCAVSDDNGTANSDGARLTLIPASPISWIRA